MRLLKLVERKRNNALLYAPEEYWTLDQTLKEALTNGCGPKGFFSWLIPDTVYFLSIKAACEIHDYMYAVGVTEEDRNVADRVFLNNMVRIIDANTGNSILRRLRYSRANKYYIAVRNFGGPFYWEGKNPLSTMHPVAIA
jgi:hypothetical protein